MTRTARPNPHLLELNARVWLSRLSQKYGAPLTLAAVPEEEWRAIAEKGFDLVWLMGVWRRSPAARREALASPDLRRLYGEILPGWTEVDVQGSPYAVFAYDLEPALGGAGELAAVKQRLNALGLGLILDFVPNHLAVDHPWTREHPDRFVQATPEAAAAHSDWFFPAPGGARLAHGRDPNFPPWSDTAQVNFFSPALRAALQEELVQISALADGVRCDMAMLALNDVFAHTWGGLVEEPKAAEEFWTSALRAVRRRRPGFLFLAEAYWDLGWKLQRLDFDYTYDKTLYDRLRWSNAADVAGHLLAEESYQKRLARFIENHDEERAVKALGRERSLAAAAIMATVPGLRLFHDGQLEGRSIRLPVQLCREPEEADDGEVADFYRRLLAACNTPAFHGGQWLRLEPEPAEGGGRQGALAWLWRRADQLKIVAVNYSGAPARVRIAIPFLPEPGGAAVFQDELDDSVHSAEAGGLALDLPPWKARILALAPAG